ncbi:MAG: hypothetical protein DWQ10_16390 [Calditrichaeota bacterium]|nr:MAG: hypothetical protein DWQ10_16390 [Calditrichota bacterium]
MSLRLEFWLFSSLLTQSPFKKLQGRNRKFVMHSLDYFALNPENIKLKFVQLAKFVVIFTTGKSFKMLHIFPS